MTLVQGNPAKPIAKVGVMPAGKTSFKEFSPHLKLDPIDSGAPITFRFQIELSAPVPAGKIAISLADAQGPVLCTHSSELRQKNAGLISGGLELPLLPIKPGEYILSCTISNGVHPLAFLRAAPELTGLEEKNTERSEYHGVLTLPPKLSINP